MITGSKEWFVYKADNAEKKELIDQIEELRGRFLERFSPDKLSRMSGAELLDCVFSKKHDSMMHLIMMDAQYRNFGASSEYPYMSIIYKGSDNLWTYFYKNKHIKLSYDEAEIKAEEVRNQLLACVKIISESKLNTIFDYKELEKRLSNETSYNNYVTFLKYYQMVFPYYFPGMYSDFTLNRCIQILGLRSMGKNTSKRISNMGVISIFIRNCDINNIVFGSVYADEWGWEKTCETCLAADANETIISCPEEINTSYYSLGNSDADYSEIDIKTAVKASKVSVKKTVNPLPEKKELTAVVKKRIDKPLAKYVFVKMIDANKNVSVVHNKIDGKNYIQKEYKLYNQNIFERLKKADIKGVPKIYECEKVGDKLITVEEYIKGHDLKEIMESDGTFDEEEMLHIALQICDILKELHSMDPPMIHRDIKPSNIMLKKTGEVVLIDFNASREYKEGYSEDTILFASRHFAAPEQTSGFGDSDERTDIFSLAATLSFLMTNVYPNQMVAPGKYNKILSKCLNVDKKDRYQNISELREALLNA